jgi:hypothetical protein
MLLTEAALGALGLLTGVLHRRTDFGGFSNDCHPQVGGVEVGHQAPPFRSPNDRTAANF